MTDGQENQAGERPTGNQAPPPYSIDLTGEDTGPPERDLVPPTTPYNPERTREFMRGLLAFTLVGILGFLAIVALLSLWFSKATPDDLQTVLGVVFTPIVGLVGAATGFYYGGRNSSGRR